ncbi:apo-citrate lyase phosphoribosyl-dephospho-CoA transferase [Vibrio ishigakensis]|uniref:citrate lyase holo-[acyl-carrier protein] synthase n=1 Tax=Vibrio ishigakensis TaxID=1481914 RepID=A0A0B8QUR1_9VIBR|nr:apo-citrate lyase phosphoribosyl-dephospho-CoA transferase [Vibrio ishigakensis]
MFKGVPITAIDVMEFRDRIASTQRIWQQLQAPQLISFTVNMMGNVKVNEASSRVFLQGRLAIDNWVQGTSLNILRQEQFNHKAGYHYLVAVNYHDADEIKKAMIALEESLPLGRLMDIDVIDRDGKPLSRTKLGFGQRQCIVCDQPAKACARSQAHSPMELQKALLEMFS